MRSTSLILTVVLSFFAVAGAAPVPSDEVAARELADNVFERQIRPASWKRVEEGSDVLERQIRPASWKRVEEGSDVLERQIRPASWKREADESDVLERQIRPASWKRGPPGAALPPSW